MLSGAQLPFHFDPARLRADLAQVAGTEWAPHYNERDYGGVWRGTALRSASGSSMDLRSVAETFQETALLERCAYFREVLGAFECRMKSARLLALAAGSFIREHSDHALDLEDGEARFHVPVQTNSGVEFYVSGERLRMEEGGAYYVNVNLPHRVNNRGASERIHLVIDVEVNDWARQLLARSQPIPRCAPSAGGVEAFRDAALRDPALCGALRTIGDRREFEREAVRLGRERGFDFHEGDVDAMLKGVACAGKAGGLVCGLEERDGAPFLTWTDAPDGQPAAPFYEDAVRIALRMPWGSFARRSTALAAATTRPRGFVFHMSRCGSTLVTQMFQAAGYRVASEPAVVETVLRRNPAWLPDVVASLGAEVVKLDAWHIHEMETIRVSFPETPWVFVYRDRAEVLESHRRNPGLHVLPGAMDPAALRMAPEDVTKLDREAWAERVIERIRAAAERHRGDPMGLFVDYRDLPDAVWGPIARHFGIELTAGQVERMQEAARFDAKSPGKRYAGTNAGMAS